MRLVSPILQKIRTVLSNNFQFVKGERRDLIIIDDLLPLSISPWRNHEYQSLVKYFSDSTVIADFSNFTKLSDGLSYEHHSAKLKERYPELSAKLIPLKLRTSLNAKLVYALFFNNIRKYYPHLKKLNIPYAFTLYPGGGFRFNNDEIDAEVKLLINDDLCRFVIVNQEITYKYLTEKLGIGRSKVFLVFGIPLSPQDLRETADENKFYAGGKEKFDVVFLAYKYMAYGLDKGFHLFQNAVMELTHDPVIRFHVAGNFSERDLIYPELKGKIEFHGTLSEDAFAGFFSDKDVIVSPNMPNVISEGAFDGFPLGSSIAGGVNNCVMMLCNAFNESPQLFTEDVHYVRIEPSHKDIVSKLISLKNEPARMKELTVKAHERIQEIYYSGYQIDERIKIFSNFL